MPNGTPFHPPPPATEPLQPDPVCTKMASLDRPVVNIMLCKSVVLFHFPFWLCASCHPWCITNLHHHYACLRPDESLWTERETYQREGRREGRGEGGSRNNESSSGGACPLAWGDEIAWAITNPPPRVIINKCLDYSCQGKRSLLNSSLSWIFSSEFLWKNK